MAISINLTQYTKKLRRVLELYNRVNAATESHACLLRVGIPAEQTLTHYTKAQGIWVNCINATNGCDAYRKSQIQRHWQAANAAIQRATSNLA